MESKAAAAAADSVAIKARDLLIEDFLVEMAEEDRGNLATISLETPPKMWLILIG